MKEGNVLRDKSYAFAIRTVNTCRYLADEKREFTLSRQLLRSGTSIGANVEEAIGGYSERDFGAKLAIAYKEARETQYWIRLLRDTGYLTAKQTESLLSDSDELLRILGSILKTLKTRNKESSPSGSLDS